MSKRNPIDALSITDVVVIPASHQDGERVDGGPAGNPPVQLLPDLWLARLPISRLAGQQIADRLAELTNGAAMSGSRSRRRAFAA